MDPYPLVRLNHFTVPVAIIVSLRSVLIKWRAPCHVAPLEIWKMTSAARIGKLSKADQKSSCVCLYDRHESGSMSFHDWPPQISDASCASPREFDASRHGYFTR